LLVILSAAKNLHLLLFFAVAVASAVAVAPAVAVAVAPAVAVAVAPAVAVAVAPAVAVAVAVVFVLRRHPERREGPPQPLLSLHDRQPS